MSIDLRLEHVGNGTFRPRGKLDYVLCTRMFEPGEVVRAKVSKKRSVRQNGFFHALCAVAFENQRGGPRLETWEHLRSWLLIEAGHCDEVRLSMAGMDEQQTILVARSMAAALKQRVDTLAVSYDRTRHEIVMRFAKSTAFRKCDGDIMSSVLDKVVAIICEQIVPGTTPASLFAEAKAAA